MDEMCFKQNLSYLLIKNLLPLQHCRAQGSPNFNFLLKDPNSNILRDFVQAFSAYFVHFQGKVGGVANSRTF